MMPEEAISPETLGEAMAALGVILTLVGTYCIYLQQRWDKLQATQLERLREHQAERDQKQDELFRVLIHAQEEMLASMGQSLKDSTREAARVQERILDRLQEVSLELTSLRGEVDANKALCDQHTEHCAKQRGDL